MSILQLAAKCTPTEWQVPLDLRPLPNSGNDKGLWVDPVAFLDVLNGWELAEWAIRTAQHLQFWALPRPLGPGAPQVYRDESVLLTSLVAAAWRLSYERITDWLARYDALAEALKYDQFNESGQRRTISLAQYSRRLRTLGSLPYFLIFVALVTALLKMGLIKGWDLIIDSSLLAAWYHDDPGAAWSWPSAWKGRVFGYKVHTILCRWSYLPLLFVVTPANRHDGPLAIPMFAAVVLLYHLRIHVVRADAAYFNYAFLGFVRNVLHACQCRLQSASPGQTLPGRLVLHSSVARLDEPSRQYRTSLCLDETLLWFEVLPRPRLLGRDPVCVPGLHRRAGRRFYSHPLSAA